MSDWAVLTQPDGGHTSYVRVDRILRVLVIQTEARPGWKKVFHVRVDFGGNDGLDCPSLSPEGLDSVLRALGLPAYDHNAVKP